MRALEELIQTNSQRVGAYLERDGLLVRDIEYRDLQLDTPDVSAISDLLDHAITCRNAVGPQAWRKAFTLQAVPDGERDDDSPNLTEAAGDAERKQRSKCVS